MTTSPTADVSVRVAWAGDAAAIAAVQVRCWRQRYGGLLPEEELAGMDVEAFTARWAQQLERPGDARNRVLVALERNAVRGYAVLVPSPDPDADPVADAELVELVLDPDHTGAGHGSRLLHAAADTMRADRFTTARTWTRTTEDALRSFLTAAGWGTDGAHRELDLHGDGTITLRQLRLHTDLSQD
ncbi:MAG: Acetyltransferase, GNAT family [uncultured Nocardioidaceae bacterium]|uniref:Acetyltransferase, GNAT family n=1 Tax=uncultured Nocardioidaceae bacterium TaxID=253824 RepID=A0A6J4L3I8_9ACTN|nr:MAG: Acetyltransferase, GNAT family [uncultured Nocardioidaceae bacterium]